MDRRSIIKTLPVSLILLLSGCSGHPLPPPKGTVIGRTIVAQREDSNVRIFSVNQDESGNPLLKSSEFTAADLGFVLDNSTYGALTEQYDEVTFYVTIRHEGYDGLRKSPAEGEIIHYSTEKVLFNSTQFGDFVIVRTGLSNSIRGFHRIVRSGEVVRKSEQVSDIDDSAVPEFPGYIVLQHEFETVSSRRRYPATQTAYSNVERDQRVVFGIERETTQSGTNYVYLDSVDPSRSWSFF
ncbi:hypothetical protein SAMN04488691_1035 [Haloferax larsenii]|uniref:Uncharacterized protein n=1 Tax=Haloferax larsenii TaxID=302484 RepID=A0A1H7MKC4_HALLR|nr:hypothetical protein SAMN04488691_1035 [Haloferax larsenii]